MSALLSQKAYQSAAAPTRTPRAAEYDVIARVTQNLRKAKLNKKSDFSGFVNALYENRKLWTMLASDVATQDNGLSQDLRAQIFYLAEFTNEHSSSVLSKGADIDVLIDINTAILRGLGKGGTP